MKKIIFTIAAIVFQITVLTYFTKYSLMIKKSAEQNGKIVSLKCQAYDPYDPFKGRYLRVRITEENPYIKDTTDYYLQENYADIVDRMSNRDFDSLDPELELYVDEKGRFVQKGMTVCSFSDDAEIIYLESENSSGLFENVTSEKIKQEFLPRIPLEEYLEHLRKTK